MSALLRTNKFLYKRYHLSTLRSCFLRSFSTNGGGGPSDYPPEPIPNRPLRSPSRNPPPPLDFPNRSIRLREIENRNDNDFLEKFKLGFDAKMENVKKPEESPTDSSHRAGNCELLSPPPVDADEIFNKMKETGLIPNAVAMLDGLCKDGLVQDAMKLFALMREKGMIPEVVIYTAVVEGFCKAHKFDDAVRIFKKMQSNRVVPNAFSYGVLIRGLCKGKRFEDAYEFTIEMLEAGHSPNLATFIGLIDGYCREKGGVEDAQKVISAMKQKGFFFEEKAVREYLDKKGPFLPSVWEAILGNRTTSKTSSLF